MDNKIHEKKGKEELVQITHDLDQNLGIGYVRGDFDLQKSVNEFAFLDVNLGRTIEPGDPYSLYLFNINNYSGVPTNPYDVTIQIDKYFLKLLVAADERLSNMLLRTAEKIRQKRIFNCQTAEFLSLNPFEQLLYSFFGPEIYSYLDSGELRITVLGSSLEDRDSLLSLSKLRRMIKPKVREKEEPLPESFRNLGKKGDLSYEQSSFIDDLEF